MENNTKTSSTSSTVKKPRIDYVDLAKGFCIILVVLHHVGAEAHADLEINAYFRVFRMPLYFFLSGLFFKEYEGLLGFAKRKINKLLIPFLFWFALYNIILPAAASIVGIKLINSEIWSLENIFGFIYPEAISNQAIWFLWCLFVLNILFYVILVCAKKIDRYKISIIVFSSLLLGIIGYTLGISKINLYGYLDSAMTALPFFCAGYVFNKFTSILVENKYDKYNVLFVIICAIVVCLCRCGLNYRTNTYNGTLLTVYVGGLSGTLCVMLFSKIIKKIPLVSYWGRYSIMILVTHLPLVKVFLAVTGKMHLSPALTAYVTVVIMMLCYTAIIPLMKRFLPHVTAQKDVLKI